MSVSWNPWHGCTKISPGCKFCYVYRQDQMFGVEVSSSEVRKTESFDLPLQRKRDRRYKIASGQEVYTCFTSDFFVDESDLWRLQAWEMMKKRPDLTFILFTKRIDRFEVQLPPDWGDGYDNVVIGCTVENQEMTNYRLPIFRELPIKHKLIICAPLLEPISLSPFLDGAIAEVAVSGESGSKARVCDYDWVLGIRRECIEKNVPFCFHQTGAHFRKDGQVFKVRRCHQIVQARKANIDFRLDRLPAQNKEYSLF